MGIGKGDGKASGDGEEIGRGRKVAGWRHFVAGGVGGMTGAIVTSPFDVVKVSAHRRARADKWQVLQSASSE